MEHLFVYGLFRDSARGLLENATFCGKTTIEGEIYKVNEFYPGFVRIGEEKVIGDVYLVDPKIFPELDEFEGEEYISCLLYTSPSPRDRQKSRMPSSA